MYNYNFGSNSFGTQKKLKYEKKNKKGLVNKIIIQ
jgi:hypothetical protein